MIVLFTDFGIEGPYVGQMKAVLAREAPGVPVIDLMHDAPAFAPEPAAYLLAAYAEAFPADSTFLAVVDPGVGGARAAVVVEAGGRRFVGPDNGLLAITARRAGDAQWWGITWQPSRLSASFHGRDLFAPVAARLARGDTDIELEPMTPSDHVGSHWTDDRPQVVYIDRYGNAVTGLRAAALRADATLEVGSHRLTRRRTFGDGRPGEAFWYENANGLAELSVNQERAADVLDIAVGTPIAIVD